MKKWFLLAGLLLLTSKFIFTMQKEEVGDATKYEGLITDNKKTTSYIHSEESRNLYGIKGYQSFIAQKEQFFESYKENGTPCEQQKLIFNAAKTLAYLLFEKTSYWKDFHNNQTHSQKSIHLAITKKDKLYQWHRFMLAEIEPYSILSPVYVAPIIDLDNLREDTTFVMQESNNMCYHIKVVEQDCPIKKFALLVLDQERCVYLPHYYKSLEKKLINHCELGSNLAFKILELLNKEYQSDKFQDEFKKDELMRIYKERVNRFVFDKDKLNPVFNVDSTIACFNFCGKDLKMKHAISYIPLMQSKKYNGYEWADFIKLPYSDAECKFSKESLTQAFTIFPSNGAEPLRGQIEMPDSDQEVQITFIPEKNFAQYEQARRDYPKNLREYEEKKRELAIEELRVAVAKKMEEEKQQSKK